MKIFKIPVGKVWIRFSVCEWGLCLVKSTEFVSVCSHGVEYDWISMFDTQSTGMRRAVVRSEKFMEWQRELSRYYLLLLAQSPRIVS